MIHMSGALKRLSRRKCRTLLFARHLMWPTSYGSTSDFQQQQWTDSLDPEPRFISIIWKKNLSEPYTAITHQLTEVEESCNYRTTIILFCKLTPPTHAQTTHTNTFKVGQKYIICQNVPKCMKEVSRDLIERISKWKNPCKSVLASYEIYFAKPYLTS